MFVHQGLLFEVRSSQERKSHQILRWNCSWSCSKFQDTFRSRLESGWLATRDSCWFGMRTSREISLVVQDNAQKGIVDVDFAVVPDKAEFPEFVHEKINPWARRADHLRQHLLRYLDSHFLWFARCTIARK